MGRPCRSGLETAQHLEEIVLRVRRKRVPPRVHTDARPARNIIVEPHVRGFRLVELHVPVAVRRYLFAQLLPQPHLGERGAVGWKRSGWECSRTWITLDRVSIVCSPCFKSVFRGIVFRKYIYIWQKFEYKGCDIYIERKCLDSSLRKWLPSIRKLIVLFVYKAQNCKKSAWLFILS